MGLEKNIKLCASVIFYYKTDVELVPITLKMIGDLKRCNCPSETPITTQNKCRVCQRLGNPAWQDASLQESIHHIKIETNANVMIDLIDVLSSLQNRKTSAVVRVLEKFFLEGYGVEKYEVIKPIFNLLHFVAFDLVEDFDYVTLYRIYTNFMKKSLKIEGNLSEVLMLYLFKNNFLIMNENEQHLGKDNYISIYKRQIGTTGGTSSERRMLLKYLSLSTAFLSGEPCVFDEIVNNITQDLSLWSGGNIAISPSLIHNMVHFPLYLTQSLPLIVGKTEKHAKNSGCSLDHSNLIFQLSGLANGTIHHKIVFERSLRRSPSFTCIKDAVGLTYQETFTLLYLMNGDFSLENLDHLITMVLQKYNLLKMKNHIHTLLILYASKDSFTLIQSVGYFAKYLQVTDQHYFVHLCEIMLYLKSSSLGQSTILESCEQVLKGFSQVGEESLSLLKPIFIDCITTKNYTKFRTFKEGLIYLHRIKANESLRKKDLELSPIFDILELIIELNIGVDTAELLSKLRDMVPEFEVAALRQLSIKLLKTVGGFRDNNRETLNERLKESFHILGEILAGKPNDFEQLWKLTFMSEPRVRLQALTYFLQHHVQPKSTDSSFLKAERVEKTIKLNQLIDDRHIFHVLFIDKRTRFMKNQLSFLQSFSSATAEEGFRFGMAIIKRLFLPNYGTSEEEIKQILGTLCEVIYKTTPEPKPYAELKQILTFYGALTDFIVNNSSTKLGNYFLEVHDEPLMKALAYCRYCFSPNEAINIILEQLVKNEELTLASTIYFFYLVTGKIQRRKIILKDLFEQEISAWLGVKSEFMEFLELLADRPKLSLVDKVYKIHHRIMYSWSLESESQQKSSSEMIITKEFYETLQQVINGDRPSITYLADFLRVPVKKLRLMYILTTLKLESGYDYAFDQLLNNTEILRLLEEQEIKPQELIYLLKICLNKIDYDSIADLLRLMKLDMVILPEILINLLLIDLPIEKQPITFREFNKSLLVHSAIFEKMTVSKEICWAFCRVLKGDFLNFAELMDIAYEDMIPFNHKYFSSFMKGMVGIKNYIFQDNKTYRAFAEAGLEGYTKVLNEHFCRFHAGEKENSLEYAQYLLNMGKSRFTLHPTWKMLIDIFSDSRSGNYSEIGISSRLNGIPGLNPKYIPKTIPFFMKSEPLLHFAVLYNTINADEVIIEFLHDFAFYRNIFRYLKNSSKLGETQLDRVQMEECLRFFSGLVQEYHEAMRGLIKHKKISLAFERVASHTNPLYLAMLRDICSPDKDHAAKDVSRDENDPFSAPDPIQSTNYNMYLNNILIINWKTELLERKNRGHSMLLISPKTTEAGKLEILLEKITSVQTHISEIQDSGNKMCDDIMKLFVTTENITNKDYWDCVFDEIEYLDDFLDSVIDLYMRSLDAISSKLHDAKLTYSDDVGEVDPDVNPSGKDEEEDAVLSAGPEPDSRDNDNSFNAGKTLIESNFNSPDRDERLVVDWLGLSMYIMLDRLREFQNKSHEYKVDKLNLILYKSNILFGLIEKGLYFSTNSGATFRRFMYLYQFLFSSGVRMPSKGWVKFSGSLFCPVLSLELKRMIKRKMDTDPIRDINSHALFKIYLVMQVHKNDKAYFKNKGVFTLFKYQNGANVKLLDDGFINLAAPVISASEVSASQNMDTNESRDDLIRYFYTHQFLASQEYQNIQSEGRKQCIEKVLDDIMKGNAKGDPIEKQNNLAGDPTYLSLQLIRRSYYGECHESEFSSLVESYTSKKNYGLKYSKDGFLKPSYPKFHHENIKFLNDISLGRNTVMPETKNIFSSNLDSAKYQKIYECILHLHSLRRNFSATGLMEIMKALSPFLSSNIYGLSSILAFVAEPLSQDPSNQFNKKETNFEGDANQKLRNTLRDLGMKEMGLNNPSLYHLFLLHTYPSEVRPSYIKIILEDIGISESTPLVQLLNLMYMVNCDNQRSIDYEDFSALALAILHQGQRTNRHTSSQAEAAQGRTRMNGSTSGNNPQNPDDLNDEFSPSPLGEFSELLGSPIRKKSPHGIDPQDRNKFKPGRNLKPSGGLFQDPELALVDFVRASLFSKQDKADPSRIDRFCDIIKSLNPRSPEWMKTSFTESLLSLIYFINSITKRDKSDYLIRSTQEVEKFGYTLGIKEPALIPAFNIYHWVCSKTGKRNDKKLQNLEEYLKTFFSASSFGKNPTDSAGMEHKQILQFISAFEKYDLENILRILHDNAMVDEFCFVLGYFCYIGVLNGWFQDSTSQDPAHLPSKNLDKEMTERIGLSITFPVLQQMHSSISSKRSIQNEQTWQLFETEFKRLKTRMFALGDKSNRFINDLKMYSSLKYRVDQLKQTDSSFLESLIMGKLFEPFEEQISKNLAVFFTSSLNVISKVTAQLKNFYLFKPEFYYGFQSLQPSEKTTQSVSSPAPSMDKRTRMEAVHLSPSSAQSPPVAKSVETVENDPKIMIQLAFKMREHWKEMKATFSGGCKSVLNYHNDTFMEKFNDLSNKLGETNAFNFINVTKQEQKQIVRFIYPSMIFFFLYLGSIRSEIDKNDMSSRVNLIKQTLTFLWRCMKIMNNRNYPLNTLDLPRMGGQQDQGRSSSTGTKAPVSGADIPAKQIPFPVSSLKPNQVAPSGLNSSSNLGLNTADPPNGRPTSASKQPGRYFASDQTEWTDLFNKYAQLMYAMKMKKNSASILQSMMTFCKQFIFTTSDHSDITDPGKLNGLILNNFIELYDYLEELESGKEFSENYKENIINLFTQGASQYPEFKKHIPDIRNVSKLVLGDATQLDYLIDRVFIQSENITQIRNYVADFVRASEKVSASNKTKEQGTFTQDWIMSMPKDERELIFKRADDGNTTPSELLIVLRSRQNKKNYISFSEVELIFRRLGINLTEHRLCELISASKLLQSKMVAGIMKLNFSYLEEKEFEKIFTYLENQVVLTTESDLSISSTALVIFSIRTLIYFLLVILLVSNLMIYFFGGELFASLLCALLPAGKLSRDPRLRDLRHLRAGRQRPRRRQSREVRTEGLRGRHEFQLRTHQLILTLINLPTNFIVTPHRSVRVKIS